MNDWTAQAPCAGQAELMTDATTDEQLRAAAALCRDCPFTEACLDLLASAGPPATSETDGIIAAGLTGADLAREMRRRAPRPQPAPIRHATPTGARQHYRRGEKPCQPCRIAAAIATSPDATFRTTGWAS